MIDFQQRNVRRGPAIQGVVHRDSGRSSFRHETAEGRRGERRRRGSSVRIRRQFLERSWRLSFDQAGADLDRSGASRRYIVCSPTRRSGPSSSSSPRSFGPATSFGLHVRRRLQLRRPAIACALALVHHELLEAEERLQLHVRTVFDTFPWPQSPTRSRLTPSRRRRSRSGGCGRRR